MKHEQEFDQDDDRTMIFTENHLEARQRACEIVPKRNLNEKLSAIIFKVGFLSRVLYRSLSFESSLSTGSSRLDRLIVKCCKMVLER